MGSGTSGAQLHDVIRRSFAFNDRLYALVDAARDPGFVRTLRDKFKLEMTWLFRGGTAAAMKDVAPYLVSLEFRARYPYPGSEFLDHWAHRLGGSIGFLAVCPADSAEMKSHLQEAFHVEDVDGHPYYFRFYDPRVLRTFLPTCTRDDAKVFFGPIRRILVESQQPGRILSCGPDRTGVNIAEREFGSTARGDANRR